MLARYRALGADPPFGDPRRAHGVAMEGYFWRFSDVRTGRVLVALCGVCRLAGPGVPWAGVALAAHPGGVLHRADLPRAGADLAALGAWAQGEAGSFRGDAERVEIDLGPGAHLLARLSGAGAGAGAGADGGGRPARRRAMLGGSGVAHLLPGLGQYWHPHLFGTVAAGSATVGGETIDLAGFAVYAEKNWSPQRGGFPARWWWGQAQGFADPAVGVAFAGGEVALGPARLEATGIVVTLGGRRSVRLGNPLIAPARVTAGDGRWSVRARGPVWSVAIEGAAGPAPAHLLPIPDPVAGHSVLAAHEHLAGRLGLVVRRRGRIVFAGESGLAGLEVGRREGPQA